MTSINGHTGANDQHRADGEGARCHTKGQQDDTGLVHAHCTCQGRYQSATVLQYKASDDNYCGGTIWKCVYDQWIQYERIIKDHLQVM